MSRARTAAQVAAAPRLVLHIDRLVLHGVDRGAAGPLSDALRTALHGTLQQALADPAALATLAAGLRQGHPHLHAGPAAANGSALGQALAGALLRGSPMP